MNKFMTGTIAAIVAVGLIAGTTYATGNCGGGKPPKINIPPVVIKVTPPKPQPKPPVVVDKPVITTPTPVATPATVVVEKIVEKEVVKEVPAPVAALPQTGVADSLLASMAGLGALTFAGAAFIRSLRLS